ncbi:MAG: nucleoside-diphosphate sugar epimerase, partial [Pedobacter sp.]|jgi:hypothetical protein
MENDIADERFIINSENRTYQDLFTETALKFGRKPPSVALSPWMMYMAWLGTRIITLLTGRKFGLSPETITSAFKKQKYSNEKIKKTLNLDFKPVADSISEICLHLKNS